MGSRGRLPGRCRGASVGAPPALGELPLTAGLVQLQTEGQGRLVGGALSPGQGPGRVSTLWGCRETAPRALGQAGRQALRQATRAVSHQTQPSPGPGCGPRWAVRGSRMGRVGLSPRGPLPRGPAVGSSPKPFSLTAPVPSLCPDPSGSPAALAPAGRRPTAGPWRRLPLVSRTRPPDVPWLLPSPLTASPVPFSRLRPARWVLWCLPAGPPPMGPSNCFPCVPAPAGGPRLGTHQGTGGADRGLRTLLCPGWGGACGRQGAPSLGPRLTSQQPEGCRGGPGWCGMSPDCNRPPPGLGSEARVCVRVTWFEFPGKVVPCGPESVTAGGPGPEISGQL